MASRNQVYTAHPALGGLDVSTDPSVLDPNFLTAADNIEYLEGGQRKKRIGLIQYAPTSSYAGTRTNEMVSSGPVRGLSDIWFYGTSLASSSRMVAVCDRDIFSSTGAGIWNRLTTGSSFGSSANLASLTRAMEYVVISDGRAIPRAYNPATSALVAATSGADFPVFQWSVFHLNRLFYGPLTSSPHSVYYTAADNIFDTTGIDAGRFSVNTGDGDRVIGCSQPFYEGLYVFKGPQYGGVWQLSGRDPTTFSLQKVATGAPAQSHWGIVTTPTDIYWISSYGVHSLQTTVKFGDVDQAVLSLPIQRMWRTQILTQADLINAVGFWNPVRNIVGWLITPANVTGAGARSWLIIYNYALSDPSPGGKKFWSVWKVGAGVTESQPRIGFRSATMMIDRVTGIPYTHFGGDNGLTYTLTYAMPEDDGSAYTAFIRTPAISRLESASETQEKSFTGIVSYYNPTQGGGVGPTPVLLTVTVDGRTQFYNLVFSKGGDALT
jgi:hypothetical protein